MLGSEYALGILANVRRDELKRMASMLGHGERRSIGLRSHVLCTMLIKIMNHKSKLRIHSDIYSYVNTGLALQLSAFVPHMDSIDDTLMSQAPVVNGKEQ
jgi:hypothetical protein